IFYASVGTTVGDIGIREVGSREKLVLKNFKVNYLSAFFISQQKKQLIKNGRRFRRNTCGL
nr:protein TOPLESS [Tanacetum cinerariifolium]